MKRRWTCPRGEHPGVLAPSRLRKIDIRRFCLDCSVAAGVLVERVAPALERQRAAKAETTKAKAQRARASARRRTAASKERSAAKKAAREAAMHEIAGDLRTELERLWPIALRLTVRDDLPKRPPRLIWRRRSDSHVSGHAKIGVDEICVSVGDRADTAAAIGTLAHEVAHRGATDEHRGSRREFHGPAFWAFLARLVREAYGVEVNYAAQQDRFGRQLVVEEAIRGRPPENGSMVHFSP